MIGYSGSEIGGVLAHGGLALVVNPLLYIGLILIWWERYLTVRRERRLFGTRVSTVWPPVLANWLESVIAGVLLSAACLVVGVAVTPWAVAAVTVLCLALGLVRARLVAAAYAIAILLLAAIAAHQWPHALHGGGVLAATWGHLRGVDPVSWLALCAGLFLAEGIVGLLRRGRPASPAYVMGRRGRPFGAMLLQWSVVIPVLSFTPGGLAPPHPAWSGWPWAGVVGGGVSLLGMPLMAGFSGLTSCQPPRRLAASVANRSLLIALLLAADAYAVHRFGWVYGFVGAAVALLGREWIRWSAQHHQAVGEPLYTSVPEGVRVLIAVPGSLAAAMALTPGEVVAQINEIPVHTAYDLHFALDQNPAYAKLQVLDVRGEVRFAGKPIYAGERHRLGLIPAPDEHALVSYRHSFAGLYEGLYTRVSSRNSELTWSGPDTLGRFPG